MISRPAITFILITFANIGILSVYSNSALIHLGNENNGVCYKPRIPQIYNQYDNKGTDRSHYAVNPVATKRLALTEEHLVAVFSDILNNASISVKRNLCFRNLEKYLMDFKLDIVPVNGTRGIFRANIVTGNPNLVFRMIRRLVVTLLNYTVNSCKVTNPDIETIINDTFTAVDLTVPIQSDYENALMGILRIHYIYGFNVTSRQFRSGIFYGNKTKAFLHFEDCLALGNKAMEFGAEALAYQWFVSASIRLSYMHMRRERLSNEKKNLEISWLNLQSLVKVDSLEDLHELLRDKQQESFHHFYDYDFYATYRNEYVKFLDKTMGESSPSAGRFATPEKSSAILF